MKAKHIDARIQQCLILATLSPCPRRKFGAVILDPIRNVILSEGYNGTPRGGKGTKCGGYFCERDGIKKEDYSTVYSQDYSILLYKGEDIDEDICLDGEGGKEKYIADMEKAYPSIPSGQQIEKGCHHAEMNAICNAAANGTALSGSWLFVTGEPCLMCAKLIHHSGIKKILLVKGGYLGGEDGIRYLGDHGVEITHVEGPQDPRTRG